MDPSAIIQLIILIILLVLSGFFSSAETALTTVNLNKLRLIIDEGGKKAKSAGLVIKMREDSKKLLSAILIGNNIVNISASALAAVLCTNLFGSRYVGFVTGILTLIVLVFGEITPKTVASINSLEMSLFFSKPVYAMMVLFTPIIWLLDKICRGIFFIIRIDPDKNPDQMTEDELLKIVDVSSEEGVIENDEKKMINNVVDFGDIVAKDIMIPRADMVSVDADISYSELLEIIGEEGYSRIPIYEETKDHIIGILHIKDILLQSDKISPEDFHIKDVMREAVYVYEYQRTAEIFADLKTSSDNMCIVLDEYGISAGLITMEDLIEEIVGDIRDEYDEHESEFIKEISPGHYDVDGSIKLDDLNDALGTTLSSDDYDSVGGLMIELLDRLPNEGDMVRTGEVTLKCSRVIKNRVERVDIIRD
ncbi:MAG: HlyC/CorC family transporter [Eubacterium sp.]|nr:HlyC/CorC family transporter [Eubacterium sp.]